MYYTLMNGSIFFIFDVMKFLGKVKNNKRIRLKVAGATFINGEHFLVDAKGQMRVLSSQRNDILTQPFEKRFSQRKFIKLMLNFK